MKRFFSLSWLYNKVNKSAFSINLKSRYSLLLSFVIWFLTISQIVRIIFLIWQYDEVSFNIFTVLGTVLTGLFFDIGTISFITFPAIIYYFIFPNKWIGSWVDKTFIWFFTTLVTFVLIQTFFMVAMDILII